MSGELPRTSKIVQIISIFNNCSLFLRWFQCLLVSSKLSKIIIPRQKVEAKLARFLIRRAPEVTMPRPSFLYIQYQTRNLYTSLNLHPLPQKILYPGSFNIPDLNFHSSISLNPTSASKPLISCSTENIDF